MAQRAFRGLDQLMDGAISERFNAELGRLWTNIYDLRTPATKARTITLKVTIKPNANRDASTILYDIKSTPAAPEALQQTVFLRQRDDGSVQVTEQTDQIPGQIGLDGGEAPLPNVVAFRTTENKEAQSSWK